MQLRKKRELIIYFLIGTLVVSYGLFSLGKVIWKNYKINKEIISLRKEIQDLENKNKELKNLITYFQTNSFIEKEARLKLGYKKQGEKVFAIPQIGLEKKENDKEKEEPNYLKWINFFLEK